VQWEVANWTLSSHLQQVGSGTNPITVKGSTTTYQGAETLTGVFHFTTDGNTCATKNVNKSIWLGKPSPASQTVDGLTYSPGYQICPGNHWVGITWSGLVNSTSWTVTPGIYYYTNNSECDFTLPSSGISSVSITVNGSNACGPSYNASYYLSKKTYGCGSFLIVVYPNPAENELTIETSLKSATEDLQYAVPADEITLLDKSNSKLLAKFPTESTVTLDTKNIPKGEYFLRVRFGKDEITKHIIIDK
jgi:Secretion system C-terminal sorting domain